MKNVIGERCSYHIMNANYYCGLDIHKESTYSTIIDNYGKVITQKRTMSEDIPGFLDPHLLTKVAKARAIFP